MQDRDDCALDAQPPAPAAAIAVLTNRALFACMTQFQQGVPVRFRELVTEYRARYRHSDGDSGGDEQYTGEYWLSALRCGSLADVQLLCHVYAAASESAKVRRYVVNARDCPPLHIYSVPKSAAKYGRLDVLQWLHTCALSSKVWSQRWSESKTALFEAIVNRHYDVVKWLIAHRPEACKMVRGWCLEHLATNEGFATLQGVIAFLRLREVPSRMLDTAAANGALDVVKWLHKQHNASCTKVAMDKAAENGHFDVVQWLHEHRTEGCTTAAMDEAAANGHVSVVQFLHVHRKEGCTTRAMNKAAENGHLDIVEFLHEHRTEGCTDTTMTKAAREGHLAVVQFLHAYRSEGSAEAAIYLAEWKNRHEVARYLREHRAEGCSIEVMEAALCSRSWDALSAASGRNPGGFAETADSTLQRKASDERRQALIDFFAQLEHSDLPRYMSMALQHGRSRLAKYLHNVLSVPLDCGPTSNAVVSSSSDELAESDDIQNGDVSAGRSITRSSGRRSARVATRRSTRGVI